MNAEKSLRYCSPKFIKAQIEFTKTRFECTTCPVIETDWRNLSAAMTTGMNLFLRKPFKYSEWEVGTWKN